jgi:hypothetical protein
MTTAIFDETAVRRERPQHLGEPAPAEVLEARDSNQRLLLRFDPAARTAVICLPDAELMLRSVNGTIELSSSSPIRIRSGQRLELTAGESESLESASRLAVTVGGVELDTRALRATVRETNFVGEALTARADRVILVWEKCERIVGRAFDYARHAYQRVEVLLHVRAGRIRTESHGPLVMQSRTTRIQATDDVRVQGQTINLG